MSNALAIAAVTNALTHLLERIEANLPGISITTKPLDKARNGSDKNQVNLFLYRTEINSSLRNMPTPHTVKPGETAQPPLALNLYYLLTAYGKGDDDVKGHEVLGRAMSILHDHPVLNAAELKATLKESDLYKQVEKVRITPHTISMEDLTKLWATFQTGYRISATYQISVVLIESQRPVKTPLPVLSQGDADRGPVAQADLTPPFPTLSKVILQPQGQPSAEMGDTLILAGHHLLGDKVEVLFKHRMLAEPIKINNPPRTTSQIEIALPKQSKKWRVGFYTVAAVVHQKAKGDKPARTNVTNELGFSLAPKITSSLPASITRKNDRATLELNCNPQVSPEQQSNLLLGDRQILAEARPTLTKKLTFHIDAALPGNHRIRLRIDGVDSLLIDYGKRPPVFRETQVVKIK